MKNIKKIIPFTMAAFLLTSNIQLPIAYANEENSITTYSSNLSDTTAPTVDFDSIKMDKTSVKPGNSIKFSLKAHDDLSGIKSVSINYTSSSRNGNTVELTYNPSTDLYEGTMDITTYMEDGTWTVYFVSLSDNCDNRDIIYNSDRFSSFKNHDFSNLSFTVDNENADLTAPTIDFDSMKMDKASVKPGDSIKFSLKAHDDLSGIKSVSINYTSPSRNVNTVQLTYNPSTDLYEGTMNITTYMEDGTWTVYFVSLSDNCDNRNIIYNSDRFSSFKNHDFSNLSFTLLN